MHWNMNAFVHNSCKSSLFQRRNYVVANWLIPAGVLSTNTAKLAGKTPQVYLTSASIMEGTNVATFPDGSYSDVTWGRSQHGGCSRSMYLGSRSNDTGQFSHLDDLLVLVLCSVSFSWIPPFVALAVHDCMY